MPGTSRPDHRRDVPLSLTALIGRACEVAAIAELLRRRTSAS